MMTGARPWWEAEPQEHEADENAIPPEVREEVLKRDNYRCRRCGQELEGLTVHHVVYRSHGGTHDPENLVTLCWLDHRKIHDGELDVRRIGGRWYFRRLKKGR
jgi:5-methylcytosine-specific restriction endonuclease McrA